MNKAVFYAALIALILPLTACGNTNGGNIFASGKWRYKMTVAVETPEGVKTGSAVREVRIYDGWKPLPEMTPSLKVKGEAVVVDLGKRGVLFALMRDYNPNGYDRGVNYGSRILFDVFPPPEAGAKNITRYYENLDDVKAILKPEHYPLFVHFTDLSDPKTVEAVSATNTTDEPFRSGTSIIRSLESVFGKGVALKYVTVEMTREQVSSAGITAMLPWLTKMKGYISGEFSSGPELYRSLDKGDFYRK